MKDNEITTTLTSIQNIESFKIDNHIASIFVNQDISTIRIGHFSISEYIAVVKRLIKQLKKRNTRKWNIFAISIQLY